MEEKVQPYPLEEICIVKKERKNRAARVVQEKQKILETCKNQLEEAETQYIKCVEYKNQRLQEQTYLLETGQLTSAYFKQMRSFVDILDQDIMMAYRLVEEHKAKVKNAENDVATAKEKLKMREIEVDKIKEHKKEWVKEEKERVDEIIENNINEIGSLMVEVKKLQTKKIEKLQQINEDI